MSGHRLIETDVKLILNHIRTNIAAALVDAGLLWPDDPMSLPVPREYFPHDITVMALKPPCVFIVGKDTNFRLGEAGANFIDAINRIDVSVVIESKNAPDLTYQAYRYQAALHKLLAQTPLLNEDLSVKIVCKVERAIFSATYTNAQKPNDAQGVFRKEVLLELDVEHYEKLS